MAGPGGLKLEGFGKTYKQAALLRSTTDYFNRASTYLLLVGIPGCISAQGWGPGQSTGRNVLPTSTARSACVLLQLTGSGGESRGDFQLCG